MNKGLIRWIVIALLVIAILTPAGCKAPAEFQVGSLAITPTEVAAGEPVTVKADVTNIGGSEGVYTATLKVNGVETETRDILLEAGTTQAASFTLVKDTAATYNIEIDGQTGTIRVLKPAEFELGSLIITPKAVVVGSPATVKAEITNIGEATGTYKATLKVKGVEVKTKEVTLDGGEMKTVSFDVIRDAPGEHNIEIDGLTGTLIVPGLRTYSSPRYGYSISYPFVPWRLDTSDEAEVRMLTRGDWPVLTISAEVLEEELTLEDYYQADIENGKSQTPSLKVLSTKKVREAEALPGYEVDFTLTIDGAKCKGRVLYMVSGRLGFGVFIIAVEEGWDVMGAVYDAVIQSFVPPGPEFSAAIPFPPVGYKGYVDWENGFFIAYPEGWEQQEQPGIVVAFVGPMEEGSQPNFNVVEETLPQLTTAKEVIRQTAVLLEEMIEGFRVISTEELTINGIPAARATVTWSLAGIRLKQQQVALIKDKTCFVITLTSLQATYDRYADTFDTIANSFRFLATSVPLPAPPPVPPPAPPPVPAPK